MLSRAVLGTALVLALLTSVLAAGPARAEAPTALTLTTTDGYADTAATLVVTLAADDASPLVGAPVALERRVRGAWTPLPSVTTDESGRATATATRSRTAADNVFRATYAGDGTHDPATVTVAARLVRRNGAVTIGGAKRVRDERSVALRIRSLTGSGTPAPGWVRVERAAPGQKWRRFRAVRTDSAGRATLTVRPRTDTRWRAVTATQDWVRGDRSPVHRVDNVPPGRPVRLPQGSPRPRVALPPQRRATTKGADPVVTGIPDGVWDDMTGRSWHSGCPVGRSGLRLLRINYWGYDGYRYRGEVVGATGAIDNYARALKAMYDARYPIRSMYRVDRFGWSARLQGADDYRSMAAGNTSGFNCRWVVGRPGVRSPHSYGRSLDVNPWENPYRSSHGLVPNTWWASRSHPRIAWRSHSHPVVRLMAASGMRWTYGTGDSHHFDATGGSGRVVRPSARACGGFVCH
jgi:5-hydroxyisourate hydrolase-like protein (transthyretin family)